MSADEYQPISDALRRRHEAWAALTARAASPSVMRFLKDVGRGMVNNEMLRGGEHVVLSVSGGKDSLALVLAMVLRARFVPIDYTLESVLINWREHPHDSHALAAIRAFHDALNVPLTVLDADMKPESFGGRFDCYRCGRNRRRILFDYVREQRDPVIATGHHLDDIVQTTIMNMTMRGTFSTMCPVQAFFDGSLRVVRPLCEVTEASIRAVATQCDLPVSGIDCPFREINIRTRIAPIIEQLESIAPGARRNINRAHTAIDTDYLPKAPPR